MSAARAQAPPEKPVVTDTEGGAIDSALRGLQRRLETLHRDPAVTPDHWADAQIFVKGVVWALDLEPGWDEATRRLRAEGAAAGRGAGRRSRGRAAALGRQAGAVVRGFISDVDGSTQPYGLVVPAGYDPETPIRLDVVLHGSTPAVGMGELLFIGRL